MPLYSLNKIITILGPTASGKTKLSLHLAKKFNAEIISADSRQVYRGLDIGSAKIKLKNQKAKGIKHHLIDVASPLSTFTAAKYQKLGKIALSKILKKDKTAIIVGGTGFYVESLLSNTRLPDVKPNFKLRKGLGKMSAEILFSMLLKLDSNRAKTIDKNNPRRLIRAIEIAKALGKVPPSPFPAPHGEEMKKVDVLILGIRRSNEDLRRLINRRIDKRVSGIIKEIKNLRKQGLSFKRLINFGLEYKYFSLYLLQKLTRKEATVQLKTATWRYAKRQYTYFKRLPVVWIKTTRQAEREVKKFLN